MGNCCAADSDANKEVSMMRDMRGSRHGGNGQYAYGMGGNGQYGQKKDMMRMIVRI
jgi:hypothetical protein